MVNTGIHVENNGEYIMENNGKINIDPETHLLQWKLILKPLSARVYVNLLEGNQQHGKQCMENDG